VAGAAWSKQRNGAIETRSTGPGGDYRSFELNSGAGDDEGKAAATGANKCRAWTYARRICRKSRDASKKEIKPRGAGPDLSRAWWVANTPSFRAMTKQRPGISRFPDVN